MIINCRPGLENEAFFTVLHVAVCFGHLTYWSGVTTVDLANKHNTYF